MEKVRINKYIADCGICSRRNAEDIIKAGQVKVNGQVVRELSTKISAQDIVELNGKRINLKQEKIYIMLNKPKGVVTTAKEQFNRTSVLDLLDVDERLFPVGRLDMDSEGLLLLTNDGEFTNKIIHPTKKIAKKYEVVLKHDISDEQVEKLKTGVDIGGYITKPAIVESIRNNKIIITIYEGKNRQIRKMCEAVDNKVVNLKRIAIGNLKLGSLDTGKYIKLNSQDIEKIFK